jgi:hypothetical protein
MYATSLQNFLEESLWIVVFQNKTSTCNLTKLWHWCFFVIFIKAQTDTFLLAIPANYVFQAPEVEENNK